MKVTLSNVLVVEDPTPEVESYILHDLVIPNPEYAKKKRMGLWTGKTPQSLRMYEHLGKNYLLPFGTLRQLFYLAPATTEWKPNFSYAPTVDYKGVDVPLYDYQKDAVRKAMDYDFGIIQAPAGSGKTQMGIAIVKEHKRRALWITHTLDLLKQSRDRALKYIDPGMIGTISEGKVEIGAGITFATVQTLSKQNLLQWQNYWDVIIVDEAHHVASSANSVTMFYKVLSLLSARHKYGLSATVHRADGLIKTTYAILGEVIHQVPEEAVGEKIMKVGIKFVPTGTRISDECLDTDGTIKYSSLINYLASDPDRCSLLSDWIVETGDGHSCLILSDRISHLERLMETLPDYMREDAVMVTGKMTSKKDKAAREQALEDMRSGEKKLLFATYSLAKEGLDVPCLDRLYMATPQKDYAVVTQSIGRIARTCEGKEDPICYDFVDDIAFLIKSYKKRMSIYRKNRCWFVGEDE